MITSVILSIAISSPAQAWASEGAESCRAFEKLERPSMGRYVTGDTKWWGADPVFAYQGGSVLPRSMSSGDAGVLYMDGFLPVAVPPSAEGPACPEALEPGVAAQVVGTVDSAMVPSDAILWVSGCGNTQPVRDGHFEMPVQAGQCHLVVHATDHKSSWRSDAVEVDPQQGQTSGVALRVENLQYWAGLVLEERSSGFAVLGFPAGSSAPQSGITVGDIVIRIDDTPTLNADPETVGALLRGPADQSVEVTTSTGQTFVIDRTPVDFSFSAGNIGLRVEEVDGRIIVVESTGPAAKRGIRSGDIVIASDGVPAAEWTVGQLTMHWRGGGLRKVTLQRGEDTRTVIVPLRRLY